MAHETYMANMIDPEVMGDMINAKIEALLKVTPYAKVDTSLVGVPGDKKTIPSWNYIGDAVDVAEGEEVELTEMTTSSAQFTIKKAMKSIALTQEAINSGYGDPVGQAEDQLAKAIAGKVDSDLLTAAYTSRVVADETGNIIGYKPIVRAVAKFNDEEDGIEKVLFIHPEQEAQLLQDSDFISADKFEAGVAVRGALGKIAGCWIKKSKKVAKVDAVTAVQGQYKVTIAGTVASGDKITVAGELVTLDSTSGASVTAAATAVKNAFSGNATYTATSASGVVTLTEKTGKEGSEVPTASIESTAGTVAVETATPGVKAEPALYKCVIIKMEASSPDTEYTEAELPALTILLKKDTQTDHDWKPRKQVHEITSAKYYGACLTNEAKVVVAKFAQTAAE